ncbi:DUF4156 domain-containing protein [Haliea sp. E17]|uniref:DUF4156 domain-containing protein n=1 Tax=Haliea sp. E17 TaxID=3401576 RepID=UPI003AAFA739
MKNLMIAGLLALSASACTWVEPTAGGSKVTLVKPVHVSQCQPLGNITTNTKADVAGVMRSEEKVAAELLDLARNRAATMGGDTLVAEGPPAGGSQAFRVYRCG